MLNKESEKLLERKLAKKIEALGGWCIKIVPLHITGLPDRLCLLPGGRLFFAEIKTTGEKPRKIQLKVIERIRRLGFKVYIIDSSGGIDEVSGG
jgi:hypothetical protein